MDIKQLIYLCNLERERHFGRAAEASFVSQPTLSMRLKNLEKELGVALINRGNNFEGFTAEGERVLAWAREIVSVYQGLKLEVESLKHGLNGTLVIGAVPQCSIMLAQLLKSVSAKFPRLDFRVSVLSADQLLEALTAHTVDIGIGFFELQTLHELHFQSQPLEDSGVDLLFHPQHFPQLVGDTPLTLREVADLPLCLAEPSRYFRRYIDQNFRDAGLTLHTRLGNQLAAATAAGDFRRFRLWHLPARQFTAGNDAAAAAPFDRDSADDAPRGGGGGRAGPGDAAGPAFL